MLLDCMHASRSNLALQQRCSAKRCELQNCGDSGEYSRSQSARQSNSCNVRPAHDAGKQNRSCQCTRSFWYIVKNLRIIAIKNWLTWKDAAQKRKVVRRWEEFIRFYYNWLYFFSLFWGNYKEKSLKEDNLSYHVSMIFWTTICAIQVDRT